MNNQIINDYKASEDGFTIVEVIVTVIVLGIFLFGFFQSYLFVEVQRQNITKRARASDIAYSNLREITVRPGQLTPTLCTANSSPNKIDLTQSGATITTIPGVDLTQAANGGVTLTPDADLQAAAGPHATEKLVAYAPYGCANFAKTPVEIVSMITLGNGDKVTHATFVQ